MGYISTPQTAQETVNTAIEVTDETREAIRPRDYGRALVYEMKEGDQTIGLIDAKGTGSLTPRKASHGNGLMTLGESIREYIYENTIREVLDDADVPHKSVGSYAVIDTGFDVKWPDGSTSPAGIYLRQAHKRPEGSEWLPDRMRSELQSVFKKYGIFVDENIQGTANHDIFDYGHYIVKNIGEPERQLPFELWGQPEGVRSTGMWSLSRQDYPWNWSHELADSFRNGHANRGDVLNHFMNLVHPVRNKLQLRRGNCHQIMGSHVQ